MIKKVSILALCALALLSGKVLADVKQATEEQTQQQPEATPAKEGEEKPAGGSFEDILESPKIKELLNQENIDWDAVMKVLGEMNYNLGGEDAATAGASEDSNNEHHSHSHSHGENEEYEPDL